MPSATGSHSKPGGWERSCLPMRPNLGAHSRPAAYRDRNPITDRRKRRLEGCVSVPSREAALPAPRSGSPAARAFARWPASIRSRAGCNAAPSRLIIDPAPAGDPGRPDRLIASNPQHRSQQERGLDDDDATLGAGWSSGTVGDQSSGGGSLAGDCLLGAACGDPAIRHRDARSGFPLKVIEISGDVRPNALLRDGDADANFFQHVPYLRAEEAELGFSSRWSPRSMSSRSASTRGA